MCVFHPVWARPTMYNQPWLNIHYCECFAVSISMWVRRSLTACRKLHSTRLTCISVLFYWLWPPSGGDVEDTHKIKWATLENQIGAMHLFDARQHANSENTVILKNFRLVYEEPIWNAPFHRPSITISFWHVDVSQWRLMLPTWEGHDLFKNLDFIL